ncbi:transcriptional regulator, TetR family [Actinobacteria bacterium OK074]|nr:transcriptional regulator, TetR family [Actinobacteria bacterium OK074]
MAGRTPEQVGTTRELILTVAERLFAEHGVHAVSKRQIGAVAGQGNNTAVGYHFGTKEDLVRAIVRRHAEPVEEIRVRLLAEVNGSTELRDWVDCSVLPFARHFAALDSPTWFARFCVQVLTDPVLRSILAEEFLTSPALQRIETGLGRCVAGLPPGVRHARSAMAGHVILQTCAEYERGLAANSPTAWASWDEVATSLIDALVGLWSGPVTR